MMDLEEFERSLLQGARKGLAPAASDRMRVQSRLVSHAAWWQPAPARRSLWRGVTGPWRGGLILGFAVGALLGFGASHGLQYAARERVAEVENPRDLAPMLEPAPLAVAPAARSEPGPEPAPAPVPASVDRTPERPAPRARRDSAARAAAARATEVESGSTLAQELALLQRARRALNRSDALLALGIVQSLDERFPDGVLMEERVATRILSLCQLERTEEAREQARRFLGQHPRSVYAERVRHSCAGER